MCKSIHPGKCERGKIIKETCTVCTVVVRLRGCLLWHTSSFLDTTDWTNEPFSKSTIANNIAGTWVKKLVAIIMAMVLQA